MTFASLEFFALLLGCLGLYPLLPPRGRQVLLLVASYAFYCYWKPLYALLIFASTVLDYAVALWIPRLASRSARRLALSASVVGNLSLLGFFKYTNFALDSLRTLLGPLGSNLPGPLELVLPIGISFYTFQTMSYAIDVYRGEQEPERDFVLVALFVSFFPQLVAGPIERARTLMPQLACLGPYAFRNFEEGGRLILWGFVKKTVVADRLIHAAYPIFLDPTDYTTGELVFAAHAAVVMIYLDFSAYSDIAKGVARLFGVELVRNFRYPHAAGNPAEFWRRWHISMSTWVRDYLFRALGGFRPRNVWRDGRTTLVTMSLVGLWHGAAWTFVLWGALHGLSLVVYRIWRLKVLRRFKGRPLLASLPWRLGSWYLTAAVRMVVTVLFFAPTLAAAVAVWHGIFFAPTSEGFDIPYVVIGLATVYAFWVFHYLQETRELGSWVAAWHPVARAAGYVLLVHVTLLASVDQAEQFIYFQF